MFDFAWSEFALIGAVALVVIGPKDLPVAIRGLAKGIKKARALASEFQSHLDEVVREADLSEVSEHVRDLKNLNVRGRIMKALDGDGSLGKAITPPPLTDQFVPSGPRALDAVPRSASPASAGYDYAANSVGHEGYASAPVWQDTAYSREVECAPPELPPMIVRRILREQDRLHPPAILPPVRIVHAGQSVAPSIIPVLADPPEGAQPGNVQHGTDRAGVEPADMEQNGAHPAQSGPASAGQAAAEPDDAEQATTERNTTGSTAVDHQA